MKRLLLLIFVIVLVVQVQLSRTRLVQLISYSPCDTPINYRLGAIDPRFKISPEKLAGDVANASKIWSNAYGKTLFQSTPRGDLIINLVYDERQSLSSQIQNLETQLKNQKDPLTSEVSRYGSMATDFKKRLTDLNSQIDYWNNHGGAPQDIFSQLVNQQGQLKSMADTLNSMAQALNLSAQKYNLDVSSFNQTLGTFQEVLQTKPEEGLYRGKENEIDIYLTQSQDELVHTLAHEMGHALGMPHNNDKKAMMYPLTSEMLKLTEKDTADLQEVCKKRNVIETFSEVLQRGFQVFYLRGLAFWSSLTESLDRQVWTRRKE